MVVDIAFSKNGLPIRLTNERWGHIMEEHSELAPLRSNILSTIANPTRIVKGNTGEMFAIQEIERGKWLIVVYREMIDDGFVITAFLTRRISYFDKREQLWP